MTMGMDIFIHTITVMMMAMITSIPIIIIQHQTILMTMNIPVLPKR
jgi:hypothetical protein